MTHIKKWSNEETALLLLAVQNEGTNWHRIQQLYFPKIEHTKIKNKFYSNKAHLGVLNQTLSPQVVEILHAKRDNIRQQRAAQTSAKRSDGQVQTAQKVTQQPPIDMSEIENVLDRILNQK